MVDGGGCGCKRRAEQKDGGEGEGAPPSERIEHNAAAGCAERDGKLDDGNLKAAAGFGIVAKRTAEPGSPADRRGRAEEPPADQKRGNGRRTDPNRIRAPASSAITSGMTMTML